MIQLWVLLDGEPPLTSVSVGTRASFECWWSVDAPGIPKQFLVALPDGILEERGGELMVVSRTSTAFEAAPIGGQLRTATLSQPGIALEDKHLSPFVSVVPEFEGQVEVIRYLWSTSGPGGVVESVTEHDKNDSPDRLVAAGKVVLVTID